MSFLSFFLGLAMMGVGFAMVSRTNWFVENFGDLGDIFGAYNYNWLSWKVLGLVLLILGFLIGFGLLQLFLGATIGRLFVFGGFGGL